MRIHHLRVAAFGPFGGTEQIDFDALGASGLFLMHGPTGSGKTSILDAICFALYGTVPGTRKDQLDRLHSDHAQAGLTPVVELEFSAGGRRLRVTRSPHHMAPKKRGRGVTSRRGTVLLAELREGSWQQITTRAEEAGQEIQDLLGLGPRQFAQVVLLPQGGFADFLHAKSDDRAAVLRRLFDITRFTDVEDWLAEHVATLRAEVHASDDEIRAALLRVQGAHEQVAPQIVQWLQVPGPQLPCAVRETRAELDARLSESLAAAEVTKAATGSAEREFARADAREKRRARLVEAQAVLDAHEARADELAEQRAKISSHERAALVQPHLEELERAERTLDAHRKALRTQEAALTEFVEPPFPAPEDLADATAALDGLPGLAERVAAAEARTAALEQIAAQAAQSCVQHDSRISALRSALERLRSEFEGFTPTLGAADHVEEMRRVLDTFTEQSAVLTRAAARDDACGAELAAAEKAFAEAESAVIELRARRLAGMAGELAGALHLGSPCPVCGSCEHPEPAVAEDPVGQAEIDAAEKVAADARTALDAASTAAAAAATALEAARSAAARTLQAWPEPDVPLGAEALADAAKHVRSRERALAEARRGQEAVQTRLTTTERELSELVASHPEMVARRESTRQQLSDHLASLKDDTCRIRDQLKQHAEVCACTEVDAGEDATATSRQHRRFVDLVAHRAALGEKVVEAEERRRSATERLQDHSEVQGFSGPDHARSALLPQPELEALRSTVGAATRAYERASGLLDDEARMILASEPADLTALAAAAQEARAADDARRDDVRRLQEAVRGLTAMETELDDLLAKSEHARDALPVAERVQELTAGGGENAFKMRLSSYVLAARLETVTALANESLARMTSGRYVLEHSDDRAKRGVRSGLGLCVVDGWTGKRRDTATLSGGETFMVSLALALGLGRAVLQEAGGRDLETLLVDEGFGSLDEESLEHVMTVLDDLRDGGRVVGIVSHVAELRSRIPARITVLKGEHGSSLEVHVGDAPTAA